MLRPTNNFASRHRSPPLQQAAVLLVIFFGALAVLWLTFSLRASLTLIGVAPLKHLVFKLLPHGPQLLPLLRLYTYVSLTLIPNVIPLSTFLLVGVVATAYNASQIRKK
jgi:hypothetical protein